MFKFCEVLFFSYCFLKINLDGCKYQNLNQNYFKTFTYGCQFNQGYSCYHKHNSEVEFLYVSTINIWADNYLWWNCPVYYGMTSSILGLYPLDASNAYTHQL